MRASGIFLPISALPSKYGIGSLGQEAYEFADKLHQAKQKYWQILPLTIPDYVNSPYTSTSAFAGNTMLIDVDELVEIGLVDRSEALEFSKGYFDIIDYPYANKVKTTLLRKAFDNFKVIDDKEDYNKFVKKQKYWLNDFALFSALSQHFSFVSWSKWSDEEIKCRKKNSIDKYRLLLKAEIEYIYFTQYTFYRQFNTLKKYLKSRNISLIGDIPFYVALNSADVWSNQRLFLLNKSKCPSVVAGVPPDFFSEEGQLWGNPIYNWALMKEDNYSWWIKRFKHCSKLYDVTRIDHFRAFDTYYTIKANQCNAKIGKWNKGVGYKFFKILRSKLPKMQIIAEDLGDIGQSVIDLRDKANLPGMKVMQFAFSGESTNPFLPQNFVSNCVAYLGTHDNNTTLGWWNELTEQSRSVVRHYVGDVQQENIVSRLMELICKSVADTVILSMQDLLGNGGDRRINTPSKVGGCWEYMLRRYEMDSPWHINLEQLTTLSSRY